MICGDCGEREGKALTSTIVDMDGLLRDGVSPGCQCSVCYPHRCEECREILGEHAGVVVDFPPHKRPRRREAILSTRAKIRATI